MNRTPPSLTKRSDSLRQILHDALSVMAVGVTRRSMDKLRKIVISLYQIMFIRTHRALWLTYQKSIAGQLIEPSAQHSTYGTNWSIWPSELRRWSTSTLTHGSHAGKVSSPSVEDTLHELDDLMKQYHAELSARSTEFNTYTFTIQRMLESYIEEKLDSFHVHMAHRIELVYYDYHIEACRLEYDRQRPSKAQVCLFFSSSSSHPTSVQTSCVIANCYILMYLEATDDEPMST
jgi:hypothetical protein